MPEYQDIYDINRQLTGAISVRGVKLAPGLYRLGVAVWVRNDKGQFLLSQRHPRKVCPLYWEPTGGAVDAGEDSRTAGVREVWEEIGLKLNPDEMTLIRTTPPRENPEFGDTYLACWNGDISELHFQETEVVDARWADYDELAELEKKGVFAQDYRGLFGRVPNAPVAVCPMKAEDAEEIIGLWRKLPGVSLNNVDDTPEGLARFLNRNPNTCFVAKSATGIVGTVLAGNDGRRGYLYHVAVMEKWQGKGIGKGLVQTALEALKGEGIPKAALVVLGANDAGKGFWEHMGFAMRDDINYVDYQLLPVVKYGAK